jgi:hypothetical protein
MAKKRKRNFPHPDQLGFDFNRQRQTVAGNLQPDLKVASTQAISFDPKTLSGAADLDTSDHEASPHTKREEDDCLTASAQSIASSYKERADFSRNIFQWLVYLSLVWSLYIFVADLKIPLGNVLNGISYFDNIPNSPVSIGFVALLLIGTSVLALIHYCSYRYNLRQSHKYGSRGEVRLPDPRHVAALIALGNWVQRWGIILLVVYCLFISSDELWQAIQYIWIFLLEFDTNWPANLSPAHAA